MDRQARLRVLLTLYDRRVTDVAAEAGLPQPVVSQFLHLRRRASPEQIRRLELAILGLGPHAPADGRAASAPAGMPA